MRRLAQELGWGDELEEMIREGTERLEKEWADALPQVCGVTAEEMDDLIEQVGRGASADLDDAEP